MPRLDLITDAETDPPTDDPIEADYPDFRSWQHAWQRRIRCSRWLAPLDHGVTDPEAPGARWSA